MALARGEEDVALAEYEVALALALEVGNPPQTWRTYRALGDLHARRGEAAEAAAAYGEARLVIERVAAGLRDEETRSRFLASVEVQSLTAMLSRTDRLE